MKNAPHTSRIKVISPTVHGLLDYVLVILLFLAPSLLSGITGVFAGVVYGLAVAHLALTIVTDFDGGLFAGISFRVHGLVELLVSISLIISPWILAFADQSQPRNFFIILGLVIFIVWIFTDYGIFVRELQNGEEPDESPGGYDEKMSEEKEANHDGADVSEKNHVV